MSHPYLLFDLDGTLSNPLLGFARSINDALESNGLSTRTEQSLAQYIGPPLEQSFVAIAGSDDAELQAALLSKYRERYNAIGYTENTLYEGVVEALQQLSVAGRRLAVCTSKPEPIARLVLERFELIDTFDFVSGGGAGVAKWQQIEQLLAEGVVSNESLMIGDRAVDLQAGHRNAIAAGGVLWGFGSRAELAAESPEHVFEKPSDWLQLMA